jgi:hypothetical protein
MSRKLTILAALLWILPAWGQTQDSPSLGDVARQLRSQKNGTPSKAVITNEDLPSTSASGVLGLGESDGLRASAKPDANDSPLAALTRWESFVNKMDSIDRPTMVKLALQGSTADFPGRGSWEDRLFAAKQAYVSQGRELTGKARQLAATAQVLKDSHAKADDPRVKDMTDKLKALMQDAVRSDAAFQAIILEGRDLAAAQAPAH